jgi:NAD(P)-dependent dehydrogenase (short-subunit alcohol dehydrogenase family)
MLLEGKVVIVSGIGPGLGMELSTLSAREGAEAVVLAARTESRLDAAEAEIRDAGLATPVLKQPTDISDREQCRRLADATVDAFGRIDCLINSAFDPCVYDPIDKADMNDWRHTMDVNFFGTMGLTQECVRHMKDNGGGSVVMIATMVERKPMAYQGGYAASKAALHAATKHLALELGRDGIRFNSCNMGWMWGPNVQGYIQSQARATGVPEQEVIDAVCANIPLGFIPEDGDCAKAAIFFASDYSRVVTGAALDVNGGEYMPA